MRKFDIVHAVPRQAFTSNMKEAIAQFARMYRSTYAPMIVFAATAQYREINALHPDNLMDLALENGNNVADAIKVAAVNTNGPTLVVVHAQYSTLDYQSVGLALAAAPVRIGFIFIVADELVGVHLRAHAGAKTRIMTYSGLQNESALKRTVRNL